MNRRSFAGFVAPSVLAMLLLILLPLLLLLLLPPPTSLLPAAAAELDTLDTLDSTAGGV